MAAQPPRGRTLKVGRRRRGDNFCQDYNNILQGEPVTSRGVEQRATEHLAEAIQDSLTGEEFGMMKWTKSTPAILSLALRASSPGATINLVDDLIITQDK